MSRIVYLELRLLAREPVAWAVLVLFGAALGYGAFNAASVASQQRETGTSVLEDHKTFREQLRQHLDLQAIDPKTVARRGMVATLPPAPLWILATGQSDLSPSHETVSLWRLNAPADSRTELENPSHLLAGRFDLAFVLVWLYPLCLLALVYDLMAGDRESGTLRLALSQGIAPWRWVTCRALARALPVLSLATLSVGLLGNLEAWRAHVPIALAVVLAYGLFWIALAVAVNAVARTAAGAATALGAAWVALVLVVPTLLNVAVETLYPTPSRPELVAVGRSAAAEAQKRSGALLDSFYQEHPELAPPGRRADFAARRLTVQEEVGKAIEPVRLKFDRQLAQQQTAVARWRFTSPAIAMYEALTDLAGTGYWRYRAFREQVSSFKQAVADFYTPKIHRRDSFTLDDLDRLPQFAFTEEPVAAWLGRVGAGLAGILALAALLLGWAWWRLRAARLGSMAA